MKDSPILLGTPTEMDRRDARSVTTTAPSLTTLAETATHVLSAELLALREAAARGIMGDEEAKRLASSIRSLCALAKEQRETLAEQRQRGNALATEEAMRELLENPAFRELVLRLLSERQAAGLPL